MTRARDLLNGLKMGIMLLLITAACFGALLSIAGFMLFETP
jgi:hypothetical protein